MIDLFSHATVYMGVPTNYTRLLNSEKLNRECCTNMRLFTSGYAPLLEQTFTSFSEATGHEVVERYGMTETGMNTTNPLDRPRKPGTVGLPLPGVSPRVVDEHGEEVSVGQAGNLQVKGGSVFDGYWKLPEKTRQEQGSHHFRWTQCLSSRSRIGFEQTGRGAGVGDHRSAAR